VTWSRTLSRTFSRDHEAAIIGQKQSATQTCYLPLLPPGPDGVRNCLLRGARPRATRGVMELLALKKGIQPRVERISGYRTPLTSHLAQPGYSKIIS